MNHCDCDPENAVVEVKCGSAGTVLYMTVYHMVLEILLASNMIPSTKIEVYCNGVRQAPPPDYD